MRKEKKLQIERIYSHYRSEELRVIEMLRAARFSDEQLMHRLVTVQKRRSKAGKILGMGIYGK